MKILIMNFICRSIFILGTLALLLSPFQGCNGGTEPSSEHLLKSPNPSQQVVVNDFVVADSTDSSYSNISKTENSLLNCQDGHNTFCHRSWQLESRLLNGSLNLWTDDGGRPIGNFVTFEGKVLIVLSWAIQSDTLRVFLVNPPASATHIDLVGNLSSSGSLAGIMRTYSPSEFLFSATPKPFEESVKHLPISEPEVPENKCVMAWAITSDSLTGTLFLGLGALATHTGNFISDDSLKLTNWWHKGDSLVVFLTKANSSPLKYDFRGTISTSGEWHGIVHANPSGSIYAFNGMPISCPESNVEMEKLMPNTDSPIVTSPPEKSCK